MSIFKNILFAILFFTLGAGAFFMYSYYTYDNALMRFYGMQNPDTYTPIDLQTQQTESVYTPDFLNNKKEELIQEKKTFITADLTKMRLAVYKEGGQVFETSIMAKGKDGTSWETPAGVYQVLYKNKKHFSSLGRVWMPWSLQFQGNFFIHGVPFFPNGREIFSQYSNGCIRLNTADAKKVFEMIPLGAPVIVFESPKKKNIPTYAFQSRNVSASASLVADLESGFVFNAFNEDASFPLQEITHILASVVATEHLILERGIYVDREFIVPTAIPRLEPGQKWRLYDYLFLSLQESSHEAVYAMVRPMGLEKAVRFIQAKAHAVGMKNTNIVEASGIDDRNNGTAADVFQLARYMYYNRDFLLRITADRLVDTEKNGAPRFQNIQNTNVFSDDPTFVGGKSIIEDNRVTGGVFIFNMPFNEITRPVVFVLFDSQDAERDVNELKVFVENNFIEI